MNPIVLLFKRSLKRRFDHLLDDLNSYDDRCCAERAAFPFPEMDMVMFVFPLLAYAALACRRGERRQRAYGKSGTGGDCDSRTAFKASRWKPRTACGLPTTGRVPEFT